MREAHGSCCINDRKTHFQAYSVTCLRLNLSLSIYLLSCTLAALTPQKLMTMMAALQKCPLLKKEVIILQELQLD